MEEYKSICALEFFINNLQNNYGPIGDGMYDITTISRRRFMRFVNARFDITNPIAYDENKAIVSREHNLEDLQQYPIEDHIIPIPLKEIDAPSFDDGYPTWEEINWTNCPPQDKDCDDLVCKGYTRHIK